MFLPALIVALAAIVSAQAGQLEWHYIAGIEGYTSRWNPAAMVYDESRGRVVLFGGRSDGGLLLNDTWEFDRVEWKQIDVKGPPPRMEHEMIYDSLQKRIILFGGWAGEYLGDMWEWNGVEWNQIQIEEGPRGRSKFAIAYDTVRHKVVLFGGETSSGVSDETWEWHGTQWEKIEHSPGQLRPSARSGHLMCFDRRREKTILFGGSDEQGALVDLWEWDGTAWSRIDYEGESPQNTDKFSTMIYHVARERIAVFHLDSFWELDEREWKSSHPTAPYWSGVGVHIYNPDRNYVLMFSRHDPYYHPLDVFYVMNNTLILQLPPLPNDDENFVFQRWTLRPTYRATDRRTKVTLVPQRKGGLETLIISERIPYPLVPMNIDGGGIFDTESREIRWVVTSFEGGSQLSYELLTSEGARGCYEIIGKGKYQVDGREVTFSPVIVRESVDICEPDDPSSTPIHEEGVYIFDKPGQFYGDLTGKVDFDPPDKRSLTVFWNAPQGNARSWHVYGRAGLGGMKFLGRTWQGDTTNFVWLPTWYPGVRYDGEFVEGPNFNSTYNFRVIRIDDELSPDDFFDMAGPVGFAMEGAPAPSLYRPQMPNLNPGQVSVYDDILGGNDLAPTGGVGHDTDKPQWRAIQIAWNFGVDPSTVNQYHVQVSVDDGDFEYLGQTGTGEITYFWWTPNNEFKTASKFADGPEGGRDYQFRVILLPFSGPMDSLTSGKLMYSVTED